jgi:heme exporter protein B
VEVSAVDIADTEPYLLLLGAFLLAALVLAPAASSSALRISLE